MMLKRAKKIIPGFLAVAIAILFSLQALPVNAANVSASSLPPTIPFLTSSSGFAVVDQNRTPTTNKDIYDTYPQTALANYKNDSFYINKKVLTPPITLNPGSDDYTCGVESYLRNINDLQLYRTVLLPGNCITLLLDDNTAGIGIYAADGTMLYRNADFTSNKTVYPEQINSNIIASATNGDFNGKTAYQFKTKTTAAAMTVYVYVFPKVFPESSGPFSLPSYYCIWSGAPAYALSQTHVFPNSSVIFYPSTTSGIKTVNFSTELRNYMVPKNSYIDKIKFVPENEKGGSNVTGRRYYFKLSSKSYWTYSYEYNDFTNTFYTGLQKTPLMSSFDFKYSISRFLTPMTGDYYWFGARAVIDYVYELGTCREPLNTP